MFTHSFVVILALIGIIFAQQIFYRLDRRKLTKREDELVRMLMARDFTEFVEGQAVLTKTPKDTRKEMKIENDLVLKADKQARADAEKVIPIQY